MPTVTSRATTAATTAGTWSVIGNATNAGTGTYATWTDASRRGVGTLTFSGWDFSAIPAGATINSIKIQLRHFASSATNIETVTISGVSVPPVPTTATVTEYTQPNNTIPSSVAVSATRANNTTSSTWSIDYLDLTVDYTEPAAPPNPPTNLTATADADSIDLSWTAPTPVPEFYEIYRSTSGGPLNYYNTRTAPTTTYSDAVAQADVTYTYMVRSRNGSVESTDSNTASATIVSAPTTQSKAGTDTVLVGIDDSGASVASTSTVTSFMGFGIPI